MSDPTSNDESTAELPKPTTVHTPAAGDTSRLTRWIASVGLVISLLAAAAAGWALFKPAPTDSTEDTASTGSTAPTTDSPKTTVCKAFGTVSDAVFLQTNRTPSPDMGPATPAAAEAIAANARLAMAAGASYLLDNLPSNTPQDLADEVRRFAGDLNSIAMNALAGIPNEKPEQAALLKSAEETNTKISDLCK